MRPILLALLVSGIIIAGCANKPQQRTRGTAQANRVELARTVSATIEPVGQLEVVHLFYGPMPTGVAISRNGRVFVNYPRWGDSVEFTVGEIRNGQAIPFPSRAMNDPQAPDAFISVQSVVIDPMDRLWILDTGSVNMGPVVPGGPKLICVDLTQNQITKRIEFPPTVALSSTYLNDVRFDLNRGTEGMAFITDSSDKGPNGIIVVDLASGASWRKLNNHPSTKADEAFVPMVENRPLMVRSGGGKPEEYLKIGADGIAIDPARGVLYYCPLASRRLYSVSLDALVDRNMPDDQVAQTVREMPQRDFASDGLLCDRRGTLYLTDYEHNAIRRLTPDGRYETVVADPRMIWPDSMSLSESGYLYFTANQLNRQAKFHQGQDQRQRPYVIFRSPVAVGWASRMMARQ